jgi:secreted PhoX family phosphatase
LATGNVTTFAGNGNPGHADGLASNAMFNQPAGLAFDGLGNLFVADYDNQQIRRITKTGSFIQC